MQQWNYLIMESDMVGKVRKMRWRHGEEIAAWKDGPTMYEALSALGAQGWEMVSSMFNAVGYGETKNFTFVMKRPKDIGQYSS
jgi:hypothetical protein